MALCERSHYCPFYNGSLDYMPRTSGHMKEHYCRGDSSRCARMIVERALGPGRVPPTLYPFATTAARRLIDKSSGY